MALPQFDDVTGRMTVRGVIFWGLVSLAGLAALSTLAAPDARVISLQHGLGTEVETTRL